MANFSALPNELLTQIFLYFFDYTNLNELFALRLIFHRARDTIDTTPKLWLSPLDIKELAAIKEPNIYYIAFFAEHYFKLRDIINAQAIDNEKRKILKAAAVKKLSAAILIVRSPTFKKLFLPSLHSTDNASSHNTFLDIIDVAGHHKPIAFFLLKAPEFRNALLNSERVGAPLRREEYIATLVANHQALALFILKEDIELQAIIFKNNYNRELFETIIFGSEKSFLLFFEKFKERFLKETPMSTAQFIERTSHFYETAMAEDLKLQMQALSLAELIAHTQDMLLKKRQLAEKPQPNEKGTARPCP